LEKGSHVKELFALQDWLEDNKDTIGDTHYEVISTIELGRISQLSTPNSVLCIATHFSDTEPLNTKGKITIALDNIQDPGNMGTIIRIADWFGVAQIVCSEDSVELYNPKVVQSTMGSIARVKVFYRDLKSWLQNQQGIPVFATTLDGNDITQKANKWNEGILVIGNESKGISSAIMPLATNKITIPRKGKAESLNAAVACGIILSHIS
jgi:RNA methyltransferase, TrmH family